VSQPAATARSASFVRHRKTLCRGCRICELVCSATHEGACSARLSRIHIDADDFAFDFPAVVCLQCKSAECYHACPLRDRALCIDPQTGTRYIDAAECDGCGACAPACPLPSSPIWEKTADGRSVYYKCDLCRDVEGGPQCVAMCPWDAIEYVDRVAP
jgi:carbon-monoxide dehydrogenase iron sulfur subunit